MNEEIPKMEDVLKHIKHLESKIEELEEEHSELIVDNHNLKKQLARKDSPEFLTPKANINKILGGSKEALKRNQAKLKKEWVKDAK